MMLNLCLDTFCNRCYYMAFVMTHYICAVMIESQDLCILTTISHKLISVLIVCVLLCFLSYFFPLVILMLIFILI